MNIEDLEEIRERLRSGEYAVSDHAIIEARKDGIEVSDPKRVKEGPL